MTLLKQNRQIAPTLDGIRDDYLARYRFAVSQISETAVILDLGCGTGYGSYFMAENLPCNVTAIDSEETGLAFAKMHYAHDRVAHVHFDLASPERLPVAGVAVAFEVIEHIQNAPRLLRNIASSGTRMLIGSVPNQDIVPFDPERHKYHVRHYAPDELADMLNGSGWTPTFIGGQTGKRGAAAEVTDCPDGCRTIVFVAKTGGVE